MLVLNKYDLITPLNSSLGEVKLDDRVVTEKKQKLIDFSESIQLFSSNPANTHMRGIK